MLAGAVSPGYVPCLFPSKNLADVFLFLFNEKRLALSTILGYKSDLGETTSGYPIS